MTISILTNVKNDRFFHSLIPIKSNMDVIELQTWWWHGDLTMYRRSVGEIPIEGRVLETRTKEAEDQSMSLPPSLPASSASHSPTENGQDGWLVATRTAKFESDIWNIRCKAEMEDRNGWRIHHLFSWKARSLQPTHFSDFWGFSCTFWSGMF